MFPGLMACALWVLWPAVRAVAQSEAASAPATASGWPPVLTVLAVGLCLAQGVYMASLLRRMRRLRDERDAGRKRDHTFRFLVDNAQEGICSADPSGVITYANPFMGALLGLPFEKLLGRNCLDFVNDGDRQAAMHAFERVLAGQSAQHEGRFRGVAGQEGWALVSAIPLRGDGGEVTGTFLVVHDLTARKQSEFAWKESEERYRALIQQAPEAIVVYDASSGLFTDANANAQSLFGLSLDQLRASSPKRLYQEHQPDALPLDESIARNVRRVLAGEVAVFERAVRDSRGRAFSCEVRLSTLPSAGRSLVRGSYIDITDRKRAEEALRLSEQRFKSLYEQAADGIVVFGRDGRVTGANPAATELLGFSREELVGQAYADLLEPGQLEARAVDRAALQAGRTVRGERTFLCKDGRSVHADVSARLVDGDFVQVMVKDVTARRNLEKLREDVDRIIRHDLKTPLVCIESLARQIGKDALSEQGAAHLGQLIESAERMMRMINLSLDLYKMETKSYELSPVGFDLLRVVRQAAAQVGPLARSRQVEVAVSLDGREPALGASYAAWGEEFLCLALLENLVQNAVEASPRGERVDIRLESSPRRLALRNQGEVPPAIRRTFFDKYVTSGKPWGTGLGTYSAKLVAVAHGWTLLLDCAQPGWTEITLDMGTARFRE